MESEQQLQNTVVSVGDIYSNFTEWGGSDDTYTNFKASSFEVLSTLEYPYLISAYCRPVDYEVTNSMLVTTDAFVGYDGVRLALKNLARYFGSILFEMT